MRTFKLAIATTALTAVALALAATGPVAAKAATGGPRPAGTFKPPLVVDDFKPVLGCNPNTTVGQEGCAEHKVISADTKLNADIRVVFGLLSSTGAKRDFITAQRAWVAYRGADCSSQSDAYQGGTEQPVDYALCLATDSASRRSDLKDFYQVLVQGRSPAPHFP